MEKEVQKEIWDSTQIKRLRNGYSANKRRLRIIKNHILSLEKDLKILNIGIGNGYMEELLLKELNKENIFSLDPSEQALEEIKKIYNLPDRNLLNGYADDISIPDSFFDYVIASEVIEHIPDGAYSNSLLEIKRILKPGGFFIGTVPDNEDLAKNSYTCPYCKKNSHRVGHARSYTRESLKKDLSQYFETLKCKTIIGMNLNWKGMIYHHWIDLPFKLVRLLKPQVRAPHQIEFNILFLVRKPFT